MLPSSHIKDWLVWQVADSGFPSGGFVHSGGLEAAWQQAEVTGEEQLAGFIRASLTQTGRGALPFVTAVHREPGRFAEADRLSEAFITNHVANRASRSQGRAFLVAVRCFPLPELARLENTIREQDLPCHFAPAFGLACHFLGLERDTVAKLFLFLQLRALMASAVRLGVVGPFQAQRIEYSLTAFAESVAISSVGIGLDHIAQTAPILDLLQGTHDRLYSRLFRT